MIEHMPKRIDLDEDNNAEVINEAVLKSKSSGAFDGFINDESMLQKSMEKFIPTNRTYQGLVEEVKIPTWKIPDEVDIKKSEVPKCPQCGKEGMENRPGNYICQNPDCPYVGRTITSKVDKAEDGKDKSELGTGERFKRLVEELKKKSLDDISKEFDAISKEYGDILQKNGVRDPAALAAWIGRKKYGKEKFQELAAAGRRKKTGKKMEKAESTSSHFAGASGRPNEYSYSKKPTMEQYAEKQGIKLPKGTEQAKIQIEKAEYEGEEAERLQSVKASQDRPKVKQLKKSIDSLIEMIEKQKTPGEIGELAAQRENIGRKLTSSKRSPAEIGELAGQYENISRKLGMSPTLKKTCKTPGMKVRSKGQGRGLARGKGGGPIGVPIGEKTESEKSGEELAKQLVKCNPAKERAAMRVRKAILLVEKQQGNPWTPMSDKDVLNLLNLSSVNQIPEIMRKSENRPPAEWFNYAVSRASLFSNTPIDYAGEVWFGKGWKTLAGTGLGGVVGGLVGGPVGAGLGAVAGKTVGEQFDKPKRTSTGQFASKEYVEMEDEDKEKSTSQSDLDQSEESSKEDEYSEKSEKIEKIGPLAAGLIGAGAGYLGSKILSMRKSDASGSQLPLDDLTPEELGNAVIQALNEIMNNSDDDELKKQWGKFAAGALKDPKAMGEGIHEAGKGVKEAAEGIAQLRNPLFTQKSVAEPLDSKMQPQKRKPVSDFGGESTTTVGGSHVNTQDLAGNSEKVVTN